MVAIWTMGHSRSTENAHPESLPRVDRMRRRYEFLAVQSQGRRVHTEHFVLVVRPHARQRLGVTVTRRVAGAVGRNRIKRLAREVFRRNRTLFPPKSDLVLVARSGADTLDYEGLRSEVAGAQRALADAASRGPRPARRARKGGARR